MTQGRYEIKLLWMQSVMKLDCTSRCTLWLCYSLPRNLTQIVRCTGRSASESVRWLLCGGLDIAVNFSICENLPTSREWFSGTCERIIRVLLLWFESSVSLGSGQNRRRAPFRIV